MSEVKFQCTKEILEKVKNGDSEATVLLYKNIKNISYKKAYSILKNHHDAEDISEDVFVKAIEKIDTIKKPNEFTSWISKVAENKAKDLIKKSKPTYMGEDFEYSTDDPNSDQRVLPENVAESNENIDLYKQLISKLSDNQRTALILNKVEEKKFREIAEILGCSENTVKSRVRLGEIKLKREAEKLKKKGYTLNGMLPLEFFTYMSNTLGITASNIASILGLTTNALSLKAMISIVTAILTFFSGLLGISLVYGEINPQQYLTMNNKSTDKKDAFTSLSSSANQTIPSTSQASTVKQVLPSSSQMSSTNQATIPTSEKIAEPENVATVNPINVVNPQNNITTNINPFTLPKNNETVPSNNNYNLTIPSSNKNTSTTTPSTPNKTYFGMTEDEISYLRTVLVYANSKIPSFNTITDFSKLTDEEMMLLFSKYYELSQNYTEGIELFPSTKVVKNDGVRPTFNYKLPLSTAREVAKNAFGKTFSDNININIENSALNTLNFNIANDYLDFTYRGEVSNPKRICDIENVEYSDDRISLTVLYKCNGTSLISGAMTYYEKKAVFKRNYNNSKFPFMLISNTLQKETNKDNSNYQGKDVNFGEMKLNVPKCWGYEYIGDNVINFYEPKTRKKGGTGNLLSLAKLTDIERKKYHSTTYIIDFNDAEKGCCFIFVKNNQAYVEKGEKYPTKEWQEIYDEAYDWIPRFYYHTRIR